MSDEEQPGAGTTQRLRVGFVPGVTPDKWARRWAERMSGVRLDLTPVDETEQRAVLVDGRADMCFVRLPVDRDGLHLIPLYDEVPVVLAHKDHLVSVADEVVVADLAEDLLLQDPDEVPGWRDAAPTADRTWAPQPAGMTTKQAVETVAAGTGILILPLSVARLHHRKDVVHRPVTDLPPTKVGLAWLVDKDDDRLQEFVGVVRGRTANSSRGETRASKQRRRRR